MEFESALTESLMRSDRVILPIILCFYSGDMPDYVARMPREPEPAVGMAFGADFLSVLENALTQNAAVHDGAIMIGREQFGSSYRVSGWSYRLLPPAADEAVPNKGSAFNSCLAMSSVRNVDLVYLFNRGGLSIFRSGAVVSP
jgi:hypothetical protein